jgi:ATP-binding cassette subfamily B protein
MSLEYLMRKVSFVFQDVFLFKQSIMDNIRIGNKNASDEQVIARCEGGAMP